MSRSIRSHKLVLKCMFLLMSSAVSISPSKHLKIFGIQLWKASAKCGRIYEKQGQIGMRKCWTNYIYGHRSKRSSCWDQDIFALWIQAGNIEMSFWRFKGEVYHFCINRGTKLSRHKSVGSTIEFRIQDLQVEVVPTPFYDHLFVRRSFSTAPKRFVRP